MDYGWHVFILPWVVSVWELVKENLPKEVLEFLEIPPIAWRYIIKLSERTAVEGFAFLNQVRFSFQARKQGKYLICMGLADLECIPTVKSMANGGVRNRAERISGS